jgi:hypothetical protein
MSEKQAFHPGDEGHEKRDIDVRKVAIYGVGVLLALCLTGLAVTLLVFKEAARENEGAMPSPVYETRQTPPEPRLQAYPALDLKKLREYEESRLHSYGWVDRSNGVVRMPIDRAMEIVLEKGLPARPDARIEAPSVPIAAKGAKGGKK